MGSLNESLKRFERNKNDKIMLVTGVWGVGKTHQVINEWAKKKKSFSKKFKVVTLFGCEKVDSIIWDILLSFNAASFFAGGMQVGKSIIQAKFGVDIPADAIMKSMEKLTKKVCLKDKIIIIDDIERKSEDIKLKEALSLVESIKNNFKKIVLIMDRTKLEEKDEKFLADYFEKIIDRHFEIKEPSDEARKSILKEISSKQYNDLDISEVMNLRTLQKLNSYAYDLKKSSIGDISDERKLLYYKLYLYAYRMVKNNEFSARDYAINEKLFTSGLLLSEDKKSEYEKIQADEEYMKKQEFIYSHYSEAELLTRQVFHRSVFNKVKDLEKYFDSFIESVKCGDLENTFNTHIDYSFYPKKKYESISLIYGIKDLKKMYNEIATIINKDEYDPVSVYINYFNYCVYNGAEYIKNDYTWFESSFKKAAQSISKLLIENKYLYDGLEKLPFIEGHNEVGALISNIISKELEKEILDLIECELKIVNTDYHKIDNSFQPYKAYKYLFKRCVDKKRYLEVGKLLISKIFGEHLKDFYLSFYNVYTNCFYHYIDIPFESDTKNELKEYAKTIGYKE